MTRYELKYKDETTKRHTRLILSYSRGKLRKVELKAGMINFESLNDLVPSLEENITPADNLTLLKESKAPDSFFLPAQKAWAQFFFQQTGLEYRFTAGDGKALKAIGEHMTKVAGGTEEALDAWAYLLKHWNRLDDFYRRNVDLKFINSQLNKILNILKNGQQTGQTATRHHADAFRQRFTS